MRKIVAGVASVTLAVVVHMAAADPACLNDPGPKAAVVGYVTAMKEKRFEDAYDFVTATMTDGKPVADWAGLQRKMFELGGVAIGDIDVRDAKIEATGSDSCAPVAQVPNVLHAVDVLNNQGSTEFEVYTVKLDGGKWRVDSQETLFNEPAIRQWFPHDKIPDFKDTAPPAQ